MRDQFDGSTTLIWTDATNGASAPSPSDIISHITSGFSASQLRAVKNVAIPADIPSECPQNFNLFSECFAAIVFNDIPTNGNSTNPINYTIRADAGLSYINVQRHNSDFEKRILPLQWAVDKVNTLHFPVSDNTGRQQSRHRRS
jgi:ATP-binding cassette subfamily A (ABC1) protein 3